MPMQEYASDAIHRYLNELALHVVADSGIPSDGFHLGKILLRCFRESPDLVLHIDGGTDESENFGSGLKRSVQCASAFQKMGLKTNDVIMLMAPNYIHIPIPIYAALYLGVASCGVDINLGIAELEHTLSTILPKIIFCQNEKADDVQQALKNINHDATIITFDNSVRFLTFSDFLKSEKEVNVTDFRASDFIPETTGALLIATSGTTGLPKFATISHKNCLSVFPYLWTIYNSFPAPCKMHFVISPLQWVSATSLFIFSPIIKITRLQTSLPLTEEHFYNLVDKFRPSSTLGSPNFFMQFFKESVRNKFDLACFERIMIGGSAVPLSLCDNIKATYPNTTVSVLYGLSECTVNLLDCVNSVRNCVGTRLPCVQYKIVNPETEEEIDEPNLPGELWVKSPGVFLGYYNSPEMTDKIMTKDGWLKTGDILYRDEKWNFFFVERLKMLMKYMNHQISPVEIEAVIMKHPGVYDVAVTGIPDERGDLPLACVVLHEGREVTAQEIKDMVKEALADSKQLRGGVIFMKELPMTTTFKVNRAKLSSMVKKMERYKFADIPFVTRINNV